MSKPSGFFAAFRRKKRQTTAPADQKPTAPKRSTSKSGLRTSQSQTLRHRRDSFGRMKALSADALNQMDPEDLLAEALRTIGDQQPIVARSTPKRAVIQRDDRRVEEKLRKDCIFQPEVYDKMLSDSLLVCDLLQTHLDDCISTVRTGTPAASRRPPFVVTSSLSTSPIASRCDDNSLIVR